MVQPMPCRRSVPEEQGAEPLARTETCCDSSRQWALNGWACWGWQARACKLAKVTPEFTRYEGDDPDTYALVVSIARRHMSKGAMAMVAARAYLVSNQEWGKGDKSQLARSVGVEAGRIT